MPENGFIGSAEFFSVGKNDGTPYFLDYSGDAISAGDNNLNWSRELTGKIWKRRPPEAPKLQAFVLERR